MEQFSVVVNSSLQESSADEQVLRKNNKIQQMLLPFKISFLFWCGRRFLPEFELGKKFNRVEKFHLPRRKVK